MTTKTDVQYWADKLQDNTNQIAPLLSKMYEEHCDLPTEEQYVLRELLNRNRSLVTLLNKALSTPDPVPTPRWKKYFRK